MSHREEAIFKKRAANISLRSLSEPKSAVPEPVCLFADKKKEQPERKERSIEKKEYSKDFIVPDFQPKSLHKTQNGHSLFSNTDFGFAHNKEINRCEDQQLTPRRKPSFHAQNLFEKPVVTVPEVAEPVSEN